MSDSPITLRGRGGGVVFQGTQSPGGGSIPQTREQIGGLPVTIADGASVDLTWDASGVVGDALLDLTDPTLPAIVEAGVYAVTVATVPQAVMTAAGQYQLSLALDTGGANVQAIATSPQAGANDLQPTAIVSLTFYVPAGGVIECFVNNFDGTQTLDFGLSATIQRLS